MISIIQWADFRLGREARTEADFQEAGLAMMGGCQSCGASIAAYNAYPSRSGYWRCADCIHEGNGFETCEEADAFDVEGT